MIRNIINIDEEKCVGCGLCANACHQGAIKIIDKKAKLMRDDYCDGLGMCIPHCPTGALTILEKETTAFSKNEETPKAHFSGCPSSKAKEMVRESVNSAEKIENDSDKNQSELINWPVQIKLVPPKAPFYDNRTLVISADCVAFSYKNFHNDFMRNKAVVIGCPKLDDVDYQNKLTDIISNNDIKSVIVVRMEVPCCGGIENATRNALKNSGKMIPWQVVTISTDGKILED